MFDLSGRRDGIIKRINYALEKYSHLLNPVGLEEGIAGLSLFNYYLYLDTKDSLYLDKVATYLDHIFDYLSSGESIKNVNFLDLIELGKLLCFFNREGLVDNNTSKIYLSELTPIYKLFMEDMGKKQDLDSVSGLITIGHFYLESNRLIDHEKELQHIVRLIEKLSMPMGNSLYWKSVFRKERSDTIESGFFHGMAGIVFFLALVYNEGILKNSCLDMINRGICYLTKFQTQSGINLYPIDLKLQNKIAYHNLAYGDLGVAYSLYRSGIFLGCDAFKSYGISLFENASFFRDDDNYYIKDAELIYGASGLFALFEQLYKETLMDCFKNASDYWFEKVLFFCKGNNAWAGYETYINGFEERIQLSFSHGICGIGITLINQKIEKDCLKYLSFFNYK